MADMMREKLHTLAGELEAELKDNILSWWMKYSPDEELGGFHGRIDHENNVTEGAGRGAIMHARILWTFSAAYRMFPEQAYLNIAHRAFDYIIRHFTDKKYGGVYWEVDEHGQVVNNRKQIYAIAFTIYGLSEYYMASRNERALKVARKLFNDIETHAFDAGKNGYTDALSRDWQPLEDLRLSEKDQNESKTMNTHLHILEAYANLYRVWKDEKLEEALSNLVDLFLEVFVDRDSKHLNLFFDDDWVLKSSMISYGHDIECAWLLHEAAEVLGEKDRLARCEKLATEMAGVNMLGLDQKGGLNYEYMPEEDHLDSDKHWWVQAEAMVGYLNAYMISGEEKYAGITLEIWEFIRTKLIDHKLGEWIWSVDSEGRPNTDEEKAGFWKCPYHNGRACMEIIRRMSGPESQ